MKEQLSLVEKILSEEKCGEGMYWCNTNKECKPLPTGFDVAGQKIKPTEVGIGKPVEGSCNHTKKGKTCPVHGVNQCPMSEEKDPKGPVKSYKSPEELAKKHGVSVEEIKKQLEIGTKVEFEHTTSKSSARITALQHLDEKPDYYTKLKKMETQKESNNCVPDQTLVDKILEEIQEASKSGDDSLHDWFAKSKSSDGKPGWVQLGGKYAGKPCAKQSGQTTKPKCGSSKMAAEMSPEEEEKAAARKRREDPNPNRKGDAINVKTESKIYEDHKEIASGKERDGEGYMARTELDTITKAVASLRKNIKKGNTQLPAWVQSKITKAADYIDTAADYLDSDEVNEEKDACYSKVKSRYSVWPSAYASGALVKCRKVGAKNWGNKSKNEEIVYEGDYWHPDPKIDRTFGGPGPNKRAREDYPKPESDSKKLRPGESYMDWNKRQRGLKNSYEPDGELIDESTRLQAETGNILAVILNWRGKTYSVRMFFPQIGMPSRKDVTTEIQKVYPGSQVLQYKVSTIEPGMPLIQVVNSKSKNYLLNSKTIGEEVEIEEDWQKENRKDKTDGLSQKAVNAYRRENPGSNLQTAVTEKKPTGKRASRRKNFCSRMSGMKSKLTSAKTARDPDSRINKALRRWNCN